MFINIILFKIIVIKFKNFFFFYFEKCNYDRKNISIVQQTYALIQIKIVNH